MLYLSAALSIRNLFFNFWEGLLWRLSFNKEKNSLHAGPLVYIVVVVVVLFITWALGQLLCWSTVGKSFEFSVKLSGGQFRLGCR